MHDLVISSLAKADMREIGDYIADELKNPIAAERTDHSAFSQCHFAAAEVPRNGFSAFNCQKSGYPLSVSCLRKLPDLLSP